MSRTSFLMLAVGFGLLASASDCRAQVGFGTRRGFVNSGGQMNVSPVLTNQNRYARLNMSVGVSQLVEMQTFTPVQGFPALLPVNPIGFGYGVAGVNPAMLQYSRWSRERQRFNGRAIPKPTSARFVEAAWKFDSDKDARLSKQELGRLALASVAELKGIPAAYEKLKAGARGNKKAGTPVTDKQVTEVFLKQCLSYDRDKDGKLNADETMVMAGALVRFLK